MIKFYPERTVEEQKKRLPQAFQENYEKTVLDQIEIDGNIIRGYMEYSFINEKSYHTQPTRSMTGQIPNINQYTTFLTPRISIKYNMMNIEDYRKLMLLLQSKNEFTVTCYDIVLDKRVTHKMYFAPPQMPIIDQQYLMALGVKEFSIELIGTNNNVNEFTIWYDYNFPIAWDRFSQQSATQTTYQNSSVLIGETATYKEAGTDSPVYKVNSENTRKLLSHRYIFKCWNTQRDGTGVNFLDNELYFINSNLTLYAIWQET
jgi:hypothetical protein